MTRSTRPSAGLYRVSVFDVDFAPLVSPFDPAWIQYWKDHVETGELQHPHGLRADGEEPEVGAVVACHLQGFDQAGDPGAVDESHLGKVHEDVALFGDRLQ